MRLMTYIRKTSDGGYEVRVTVPEKLQTFLGKANLTRRLGRVSRTEANRLAIPVIERFKGQLEAAVRGEAGSRPAAVIEPLAVARLRESAVASVSIHDLFAGYVAERKPAASTVKRWAPVFASLAGHLGHVDGARIAADDVVAWKDALLASGKSPRTVREVYLAAVKVVLGWAAENRRVAINPAVGITVRVPKTGRLRERGFTADEAAAILRATFQPVKERISEEHARARRWVPWICAYSGCRVGEVAQVRGCDFFLRDGYWVMRITPEAGSTKSGSARLVPLHSHLIEQGFIREVKKLGAGPIFYDLSRARGGAPGNPHAKKVGERIGAWVRDLGVNDPLVQPNHGWRHLFKTMARRAGIDPEIRDVLQGHAPRSVGEEYGDWPIDVLGAAIDRIPQFLI